MRPCLPKNGLPNGEVTYQVMSRESIKGLSFGMLLTYVAHFIFVQFGVAVIFAVQKPAPPLCHHVAIVVPVGSEKEMIGPNANGVVAGMANILAIRNISDVKYVADPVGQPIISQIAECAVTVIIGGADPLPAIISHANVFEESKFNIHKRNSSVSITA